MRLVAEPASLGESEQKLRMAIHAFFAAVADLGQFWLLVNKELR